MIIKDKNDFEKKLRKLKKTFFYKILDFFHYKFFIIWSLILIFIGYFKNIPILTRIPFYYYLIVIILWICCKNECILHYFLKKKMYKNYNLGDNPNLAVDCYEDKPNPENISMFHTNALILVFFFVKDKTLLDYKTLIILLYFIACCSYIHNYYNIHFDFFGNPKKNKISFKHPTLFEEIMYNIIVSNEVSKETKKIEKVKEIKKNKIKFL